MTTGEKLASLRKRKGMTQEELAEILNVSRQAISRWEMDAAFPETEKLIKISRLFECSIDYLLDSSMQEPEVKAIEISLEECCKFIRQCGYFFLATAVENKPGLRPFGMIYTNKKALYIATDKRKRVYSDLMGNAQVELASLQLQTHKWIRISGKAEIENAVSVKEEISIF